MSEGTKPRGPFDPTEWWKQWYETTARMWSSALDGGKEAFVDPYSLYQLWLKNVGSAQKQVQVNTLNTKEIWNQWYEATVGAWKRAVEMGGDPLGLTTQWLAMMEEMRKRIMSSDILPTDPFTFFRDWYNATSETWARVVDEMIGSEKFIESASPFLEIYANFAKTLRRANEEYFKNLQLPTRSDLARVAGMVVSLEEKVDRIEDALDDLTEDSTDVATNEAIGRMEGRLSQVENKLDTLAAGSAGMATDASVGKMEGRLHQVESKLHTLAAALETNEAARALDGVENLAKRLDGVESRLDRVLAALEKIETTRTSKTGNTTNAVPRSRSQKKSPKQVSAQE